MNFSPRHARYDSPSKQNPAITIGQQGLASHRSLPFFLTHAGLADRIPLDICVLFGMRSELYWEDAGPILDFQDTAAITQALRLRRRSPARPARPAPSSSIVAGSGTGEVS